jgi:hypothetical protein
MNECTRHEVGLALLAAGDADEAAARHVAACPACAAELASLRSLLGAVARTRPAEPPRDARFWHDFTRGVRLAHGEAARRPPWFWVWSLAAAGVALAAVVWLRAALPGREHALVPPVVAVQERARPVLPVGDDPAELDDAELEAIVLALDDDDDDDNDDNDNDNDGDDDDLALAGVDAIDEVLGALPTAVLDTVEERL